MYSSRVLEFYLEGRRRAKDNKDRGESGQDDEGTTNHKADLLDDLRGSMALVLALSRTMNLAGMWTRMR